jgi:hypothetical protein
VARGDHEAVLRAVEPVVGISGRGVMMHIEVQRPRQGIVVLAVTKEIDSLTAARLSTALHRELEHDPAMIVLDLTGVSFLAVVNVMVVDCAAARAVCASVPLARPRQFPGDEGSPT